MRQIIRINLKRRRTRLDALVPNRILARTPLQQKTIHLPLGIDILLIDDVVQAIVPDAARGPVQVGLGQRLGAEHAHGFAEGGRGAHRREEVVGGAGGAGAVLARAGGAVVPDRGAAVLVRVGCAGEDDGEGAVAGGAGDAADVVAVDAVVPGACLVGPPLAVDVLAVPVEGGLVAGVFALFGPWGVAVAGAGAVTVIVAVAVTVAIATIAVAIAIAIAVAIVTPLRPSLRITLVNIATEIPRRPLLIQLPSVRSNVPRIAIFLPKDRRQTIMRVEDPALLQQILIHLTQLQLVHFVADRLVVCRARAALQVSVVLEVHDVFSQALNRRQDASRMGDGSGRQSHLGIPGRRSEHTYGVSNGDFDSDFLSAMLSIEKPSEYECKKKKVIGSGS